MKFKSKKTLSMDFGGRNIKVVDGNFKNVELNIYNKFIIDLPKEVYENGYIKNGETLKSIIDSAFNLNNIKRGDVVAVISSSDIVTRNIMIPSSNAEEIEGILKYKIEDFIPIDLNMYAVQHINQGSFKEGTIEKSKILIIAVPKEIIDTHFKLLKDLGMTPKVLDIQSNAIRKLLSFVNKDKINTNIASLDIGFSSSKLTILKNTNIEISRIIPLGSKDLIENISTDLNERDILEELSDIEDVGDETFEISSKVKSFLIKLCEELDMIFRYYSSLEPSNKIDMILLQGGIVKSKFILKELETYLGIRTVVIDYLKECLDEELYLYSNSIGGLLRGDKL